MLSAGVLQDWFTDADSHRWSYYAARLRSAAAVSPNPNTSFGGYIVPRSSGQYEGGLLQRILLMVGSGSKVLKYFTWGPERESRNAMHRNAMNRRANEIAALTISIRCQLAFSHQT